MDRRAFLEQLAAALALTPALSMGCARADYADTGWDFSSDFEGKVLVVGAGAAGLAAGAVLATQGVDYEILEASDRYGGRVKGLEGFADFPIDLGAEWIHQDPEVLDQLTGEAGAAEAIGTIVYNPQTVSVWSGGRLRPVRLAPTFYAEHKFYRSSWAQVLRDWIAPMVEDRLRLNTPVVAIDYSGERVVLTDAQGGTHEADRVLVTVPVKILQQERITFTPALPEAKREAIQAVHIPPGLKVFMEFSERFYPDMTGFGARIRSASYDKLYYDAAFGKDSPRHVLALFWVADEASAFTELADASAIEAACLADLDEIFDGKATATHLQTHVQSWSEEAWIQGAYSFYYDGSARRVINALREDLAGKVFFAGEATSYDNTATVPGAMQTGMAMVRRILGAE